MKIKKNDTVVVIVGKDKGVNGKVLQAFPRSSRVLVDGVNVVKKHEKSRTQGTAGQIIEKSLPVHVSNVSLLDPKENKPTRVKYVVEDGKKVRIAKKSGQKIV
ncbi:MAG: 50S ribosomal protein L24 [Candidatus Paceibacterota bacterium]